MADDLPVEGGLVIPGWELVETFTPSGGPGGQHANKASTRVELRFSVEHSSVLRPDQKRRVAARLGPEVRVVASDERSQLRNRELALERLRSRLAEALRIETPRRPTKPTRAAKERRLEEKRHRSETKRRRRGRDFDA